MEERNIILASGSKARHKLLSSFDINFQTIVSNIDEKIIRDEDFKTRALKLAKAKASKVAEDNNGIIIAADGFFIQGGEELEKPKDTEEAKKMLGILSGSIADFVTGFCYIDNERDIVSEDIVTTKIIFRDFTEGEIENYANSEDVTKYAAGLFIGGKYAHSLVNSIEGSLTGLLYSLPLEILFPLLKRSGVEIPIND